MIRAPRSLLARILLWHAVAVALTALAVSAGVYLFLDVTADQLERQTLGAQARIVGETITLDRGGGFRLSSAGQGASLAFGAGMSAIVLDRQGRRTIVAGTPPVLPLTRIPRASAPAYFTRRSRRAFYAGLSVPVRQSGQQVWIVALQNLDHPANVIDDIVRQFLLHGLLVVLPLLLLLLGVDAFIVRRALEPVRRASRLVRRIDPARPDVRIDDPAIPAEVQPLAGAVNTALDRLTGSLQMQRDFTADAAHELRTPITLARVRAAEIADPALRSAMVADLDTLAGIVGHLLEIAELDSTDQIAMEEVDLSALARHAVAAIAPLAFRTGKTVELLGAEHPVLVCGHAHFLASAIGALLENAVTHTLSGTAVSVRVEQGAVSVHDTGPGIAPGDQDLVFRRFWRRKRTRAANAGLGLAIVQRVAQVHGGAVTLRSEPGATEFILRLGRP